MSSESWLPSLLLPQNFSDQIAYDAAVYARFCRDFVESKPRYDGKRFALKRHPLVSEKEATFWHLVTSGPVERDRQPDARRCERIGWPRPMIEAIGTELVHTWRCERGSAQRIVIALSDFSYVVILDERSDFVLLWTAYCVEQRNRREKFRREFEEAKPWCRNG